MELSRRDQSTTSLILSVISIGVILAQDRRLYYTLSWRVGPALIRFKVHKEISTQEEALAGNIFVIFESKQ